MCRAFGIDAARRRWNIQFRRYVEDKTMATKVIQDWTDSTVLLNLVNIKTCAIRCIRTVPSSYRKSGTPMIPLFTRSSYR